MTIFHAKAVWKIYRDKEQIQKKETKLNERMKLSLSESDLSVLLRGPKGILE